MVSLPNAMPGSPPTNGVENHLNECLSPKEPLAEILDFTTTVETNIKILMLGDSVGMQFHQVLEEAAGVT
jgi:hypothetical protein